MIKTLKKSFFSHSTQEFYKLEKESVQVEAKLKAVQLTTFYNIEDTGNLSPDSIYHPLNNGLSLVLKRTFDIVFSLLVCVLILSWLVPVMAIFIKLESKGPVFFKQLRTGLHNQPFLCYKFRSLKINDEAHKKQVTSNDSRVTRIGKFLRKTNLDELPQFLNVLLGHMSIVGPRPHMLQHTEEFSAIVKNYKVRHLVKPGVTGLAQVSGYRGEILHQDHLIKRVHYDFSYIDNWNIWLDLKIIYLTVYKTIKGDENAY